MFPGLARRLVDFILARGTREGRGGLALAFLVLFCAFLVGAGAGAARAADQRFDIGPAIGTPLADVIMARDQSGADRDFASLTSRNGMILIFSRSLSWCPYCMADARDWSGRVDQARGLGFNIAVATYDSIDTMRAFAERFDIRYPLLSDQGSSMIRALGIVNKEHGPGSLGHGIPHPMVLVIDAAGTLRHRFSESHYSERAAKDAVLAAAERMVGD
jgi:peroxiredoxin